MGFEKQIGHIKNKNELRDWVDSLPEEFEGVIIVDTLDNGFRYFEIAQPTVQKVNYLIDAFKYHLFSFMFGNLKNDDD